MRVLGLGSDIVSVPRMDELLATHGDRFLSRCFSPEEITYIQGRGAGQAASAAARWAAKEAFLKALGRSVKHIPYGHVEVCRSPEGPVSLRLHGLAARAMEEMGGATTLLSLSHEREHALAVVLIQG